MEEDVHRIELFRNRLRTLIVVEPVLDLLDFVPDEDKQRIRATLTQKGDICAADALLDAVIRGPRPPGWFVGFVAALETAGCGHAAKYAANEPPSAALEAENDNCVRLINLLQLSLVQMKTRDVCHRCHDRGRLTDEDRQNILAELDNRGPISGARLLLRRIMRNEIGWFSDFLDILRETEHMGLVRELQGEPLADPGEHLTNVYSESASLRDVSDPPADLKTEAQPEGEDVTTNLRRDSLYSSMDTGLDMSPNASLASVSDMDLYSELQDNQSMENLDCSMSECSKGPEGPDIVLHDYQMEVARPALDGNNIIVCLPTGSGKTRVAVYITKQHLDGRSSRGQPGKVVVLVNKVPLVDQHYSTEFGRFLKHRYKVERVSGNSQLKISFPEVIRKNDIIICTAQILENSFSSARGGHEDGIRLSDITLMVIDECHHTQKGGVYNNIMIRYLKQKHRNVQLQKEQKKPVNIPQILGLTASPGVGGARTQQKAEEHILRICANLDAVAIETKELGKEAKDPFKRIQSAAERKEDPFGDVIKGIMEEIHNHADLKPLCDPGTQNYEQWVVQKEQNAAKEENQKVRVCAEHLRQYNEALHQSNTIRMSDAFSFLNKFHAEELKKKYDPEAEESIQITDTERFLFALFKGKKEKLQDLAKHPEYENNSLTLLRETILKEFMGREEARGIIFTKTRLSAIALNQWISENKKFEACGVRASHLIGGGDQSVVKPMTSAEQKDILNKFRLGDINLLIATTVAEEGLDIKECNVVIRYGLVTNEIAMIQARGRGRAEDSSYTLVEMEGSGVAERESVNEYREKMMSRAIQRVQKLPRADYEKKEFQMQAIMEDRVRTKKKQQKSMKTEHPSKVRFSCRQCCAAVCSGQDIAIIENMHHVNVTPQFRELFLVRENTSLQERLLDYEVNGVIACKKCGQRWGSMMLYGGIECPCLHIKNFVVTYNKKNKVFSKWNELAIRFPAFDYVEHAQLVGQEDEDEEEEETE
ncbi:interferon-induced helicase C domain-containing protein 1 isoform X2 [Denticeps clupeoides]|uniref:RNA helicase n=1 Tax=Denticeps clupeoides TaxID=299321 RepID=A0AAY4BHP8_9TELE|nr:interferon-induced helicase C domain-containing protein 1 isoform X2 [Denticeps clupeoides]